MKTGDLNSKLNSKVEEILNNEDQARNSLSNTQIKLPHFLRQDLLNSENDILTSANLLHTQRQILDLAGLENREDNKNQQQPKKPQPHQALLKGHQDTLFQQKNQQNPQQTQNFNDTTTKLAHKIISPKRQIREKIHPHDSDLDEEYDCLLNKIRSSPTLNRKRFPSKENTNSSSFLQPNSTSNFTELLNIFTQDNQILPVRSVEDMHRSTSSDLPPSQNSSDILKIKMPSPAFSTTTTNSSGIDLSNQAHRIVEPKPPIRTASISPKMGVTSLKKFRENLPKGILKKGKSVSDDSIYENFVYSEGSSSETSPPPEKQENQMNKNSTLEPSLSQGVPTDSPKNRPKKLNITTTSIQDPTKKKKISNPLFSPMNILTDNLTVKTKASSQILPNLSTQQILSSLPVSDKFNLQEHYYEPQAATFDIRDNEIRKLKETQIKMAKQAGVTENLGGKAVKPKPESILKKQGIG